MPKAQRKPKGAKPKKQGKPRPKGDPRAARYAKLLGDPCNGPVQPQLFPGEVGLVGRFAQDVTVNASAGCVAGFVIYHPGTNMLALTQQTASTNALSIAYGYAAGTTPGYATYSAIVAKSRPYAACLSAIAPGLSATNVAGEWCGGNCSLNTLASGVSVTVDDLFTLSTVRDAIDRKAVETRWKPANNDVMYAAPGTFTGFDDSDSNVVYIAYRGIPAATAVSVRVTLVSEWTPKVKMGMAVTASSTANATINPSAVAAAMDQANPSWWHTFTRNVGSDLQVAARYAGRVALNALTSKVTRAVSTLALTM